MIWRRRIGDLIVFRWNEGEILGIIASPLVLSAWQSPGEKPRYYDVLAFDTIVRTTFKVQAATNPCGEIGIMMQHGCGKLTIPAKRIVRVLCTWSDVVSRGDV